MRAGFAAVAVVTAVVVAGCSQQGSTQNEHAAAIVVASTDVWGSVASAVAGDHTTRDIDPRQRRRRPPLI